MVQHPNYAMEEQRDPATAALMRGRRRLPVALLGNALLRIAAGASAVLAGLYLADLANRGARFDAALAGLLGAVSFGAELLFSIPMGMLSDAIAPRAIVTGGALLGAAATQLFGMTGWAGIFFLSRAIEGLGAASAAPPLLAHITDITEHDRVLRARAMSYFELSLLGGIALGGLLGAQLWGAFHTGAFGAVASVYLLCAGLLYFGAAGSREHSGHEALAGFWRALRKASLRQLAPVWLCVNAIVGLWLAPALTFLLTQRSRSGQFLAGIFADHEARVGWVLLGFSLVFGAGITAWSVILPHMRTVRVLRINLVAMFAVCAGLFLLNHSGGESEWLRWAIGAATSLCVMVESGFTPAALSLLANAIGAEAGRGAAMGIYSVLLSVGAIGGSLLAGVLGNWFAIDGLIYGTVGLAAIAMGLLRLLHDTEAADGRA